MTMIAELLIVTGITLHIAHRCARIETVDPSVHAPRALPEARAITAPEFERTYLLAEPAPSPTLDRVFNRAPVEVQTTRIEGTRRIYLRNDTPYAASIEFGTYAPLPIPSDGVEVKL